MILPPILQKYLKSRQDRHPLSTERANSEEVFFVMVQVGFILVKPTCFFYNDIIIKR